MGWTPNDVGWKTINSDDIKIHYDITLKPANAEDAYNKDIMWIYDNQRNNIKFNITGNKLRIISCKSRTGNNSIKVFINGQLDYILPKTEGLMYGYVVYEKIFDNNNEKFIEIDIPSSDIGFYFDAIEIDKNGILKPYNICLDKYLIQDKSDILYTLNGTNLVQAPSQILDENNFINNGFTDINLITKDLLLNKFENLKEVKLLAYTDDLEKNKCEMTYNCETYAQKDKLKIIGDGKFNILMKEV